MPQIAVAGAPGVMNNPGFSRGDNAQAGVPQPGADVDVFVVQIIAFVESANGLKGFTAEQHEHAGDPVGVEGGLTGAVRVAALVSGHELG